MGYVSSLEGIPSEPLWIFASFGDDGGFLGSGSLNDDDFSIFLKQTQNQGGRHWKKPLWSIRGKAPLAWEVIELEIFAYANCAPGAFPSREKLQNPRKTKLENHHV